MRQLLHAFIIATSVTSVTACAFDDLDEAEAEVAEADLPAPLANDDTEEATSTAMQESVAEGYVAGAGIETDDFGDEGPVDRNDHNRSMAAGLWQMILWADGAIEADGTVFDPADVDCDFGPNTETATINWQITHGLSDVDGSAGPATFGRADVQLGITRETSTSTELFYVGSRNVFKLIRLKDPATPRHAYQAIGTDGVRRVVRYSFTSACSSSMWLGVR